MREHTYGDMLSYWSNMKWISPVAALDFAYSGSGFNP